MINYAGIISPYKFTIALADNAVVNGAKVLLETEAKDIRIKEKQVCGVVTNRGLIETRVVINAAGLYADEIAKTAGDSFKISPLKGEYHLFDKQWGNLVNHIIFPIPTKLSKGILVIPTVHGNLLIGPNSSRVKEKDDLAATRAGTQEVYEGARKLIPHLPHQDLINSFAGLRADIEGRDDFVIEASNYLDRPAEWQEIVEKDADYGEIICRCEKVSKGEMLGAIRQPVPARSLDAIKRRARAGMGRCQGGFCSPKVLKILSEELREAIAIPGNRPAGIFTAGTAQRYINIEGYIPGREVVVLGSGDIGMIMARRMTVQSKDGKITSVIGNACPKGIKYAEEEFVNPLRILPTTVKVIGGELPLVSVKTEKAIPKRLLLEAMAEIAEIEVNAPVKIGQVIKDDLIGTGVSLVATRNIKRADFNLRT